MTSSLHADQCGGQPVKNPVSYDSRPHGQLLCLLPAAALGRCARRASYGGSTDREGLWQGPEPSAVRLRGHLGLRLGPVGAASAADRSPRQGRGASANPRDAAATCHAEGAAAGVPQAGRPKLERRMAHEGWERLGIFEHMRIDLYGGGLEAKLSNSIPSSDALSGESLVAIPGSRKIQHEDSIAS